MSKPRRRFIREAPEQRRLDLIKATLELIGEMGLASATVRAIAARANVTLGLIRHYFTSKEELIGAAFEYHMQQMTSRALSPAKTADQSPKECLAAVIQASLSPPILGEQNVTLWASFMAQMAHDPDIRAIHHRTYLQYRDGLEALIIDVMQAEDQSLQRADARRLAILCNAIIDGLWIEGSAQASGMKSEDLVHLAQEHIGKLLGLGPLCAPLTTTRT